ncbi:hypothetical protein [Burkholderia gladioli]|uniref:hypothetical protein n=1 Tax=Burkholderia gladioli TaxID=28095 RepID=UPI00164189C5|nr:hypothetical protein [Burkholderia gladioli]
METGKPSATTYGSGHTRVRPPSRNFGANGRVEFDFVEHGGRCVAAGASDSLFSVADDSFDGYRPTGVEHANAILGTLALASYSRTDGMPASAAPLSVIKVIVRPVAGSVMPKRWR